MKKPAEKPVSRAVKPPLAKKERHMNHPKHEEPAEQPEKIPIRPVHEPVPAPAAPPAPKKSKEAQLLEFAHWVRDRTRFDDNLQIRGRVTRLLQDIGEIE